MVEWRRQRGRATRRATSSDGAALIQASIPVALIAHQVFKRALALAGCADRGGRGALARAVRPRLWPRKVGGHEPHLQQQGAKGLEPHRCRRQHTRCRKGRAAASEAGGGRQQAATAAAAHLALPACCRPAGGGRRSPRRGWTRAIAGPQAACRGTGAVLGMSWSLSAGPRLLAAACMATRHHQRPTEAASPRSAVQPAQPLGRRLFVVRHRCQLVRIA